MTDPDRQLAEKWAEKLTLQYLNSAPRCIAWDAYLAGLSKGKELGRGEMKALVEVLQEILNVPMFVDRATVPRNGIDSNTEQVVFEASIGYARILKARKALKPFAESEK
jgi:hypothetical protein